MERTKADWEDDRTLSVIEVLRGAVNDVDREYAREKLLHATRMAFGPVLQLELRMTQHADPARLVQAFVEMNGVINGRPVRAHAAAPTMHEAIDATAQRFTQRIERSQDRREAQHQRLTNGAAWHHADRATAARHAAGVFERAPDARELRRRKAFLLDAETIDEAILDLELLDHDFFLFEQLDSAEPNVVTRDGDAYRLYQPRPDPESLAGVIAPVTLDPATAPNCSIEAARELLAIESEVHGRGPAFVFFIDADSGNGSVVYRRRDGHDGLITARAPRR